MVENQRKSELGLFGEIVVCEQLANNGWYDCTRIGGFSPCFDMQAYKAGKKYLFSVKTRNHTRHNNELKTDGYNLFYSRIKGGDSEARVQMAIRIAEQQNAIPMWAAVTVDVMQKKYDICYGAVADLENKKKIPMSPMDRTRHKKLAQNATDQRIDPAWSNVQRKRGPKARGGGKLGQGTVAITSTGKNRIMMFGPKDDGHLRGRVQDRRGRGARDFGPAKRT
jgi:hypothetical protein